MPTGAQGGGGGLHILAVGVELALTADNVEGRADQLAGAFYNIKPLRVPRPARLPNPQPKPGKRPPLIDLPVEDKLDRRGACFAADTPIRTPGGWAKVQDLKAGDRVLARSEVDAEGPVEAKEVLDAFSTTARVWHLHAGGRVIATTAEHPFWVRGRGWAAAWEVRPGDSLAGHDGRWVRVDAVVDTGEHARVYNVRVADHQTYFVGCDEWGFSVWGHNACIILYRYKEQNNADPYESRHWSIEIVDQLGSLNSHQTNDGTAPTGNLQVWERWHGKAETAIIRGPGPHRKYALDRDATIEVTDEQAAAARLVVAAELARGKDEYDLYSDSCFVYVAKVLAAAGQRVAPLPPNGRAGARMLLATMDALLNQGRE